MERRILSGFCFKDACQLRWSISVSSSRLECSVDLLHVFLLRAHCRKLVPLFFYHQVECSLLTIKIFCFRSGHNHMGRKCSIVLSGYLKLQFLNTAFLNQKHTDTWYFWSKSKFILQKASRTSSQRNRMMFLLYRSEKTVPTCVYCILSPLFHLLPQPSES